MSSRRCPQLAKGLLLSLALVASCGATESARDWSLRMPSDDVVMYRGVVELDAAGTPHASMLYPGGAGVAGLLVGILTHAAIVESSKTTQKQKLQDEADQALQPFREQLTGFRYPELLQAALRRMTSGQRIKLPASVEAGEWIISTQPVFGMTRDRQALVLDNAIALYRSGDLKQPVYSAVVRVVSNPRGPSDPVGDWSAPAEAGTALKEESAHLVAHSLEIALRDSERTKQTSEAAFRTLRYAQGSAEKMERAQPLELLCQRIVVRNLRGWLMSLPQKEDPDTPGPICTGTAWR